MGVNVEAVLLTGGKGSRMGRDKASIEFNGVPLARRIASELGRFGIRVTVLGREPIAGLPFQRDEPEFEGPLAALSRFTPGKEFVFVCSCDLPLLRGEIIEDLLSRIGGKDAAVPASGEGRIQPLCALYRSAAFSKAKLMHGHGVQKAMAWLKELDHVIVPSDQLRHPESITNVNTPEDLERVAGVELDQ